MPPSNGDLNDYARLAAIVGGVLIILVIGVIVLWQLADVLLILFAAILLSLLIDSLSTLVQRVLRLPQRLALGLVLAALGGALATAVWVIGPNIGNQLYELAGRLPTAFERVTQFLRERPWGPAVIKDLPTLEELVAVGSLGRISGVFSTTLGTLSNVLVILVVGAYLAVSPQRYIDGVLYLVPDHKRPFAREVLTALGHALRWWLLGRLASMALVGLSTAVGLWLLEMPLVLALSLIAGLLAFVPYIGPVAAAVPAILVAVMQSPLLAAYVLGLYSVVEMLESYFVTPLIQQKAVSLPPAALLTAQLVLAVLFGLLGLLLATPLAVAIIVLVQMLYVRGVLGEKVRLLGEHNAGR